MDLISDILPKTNDYPFDNVPKPPFDGYEWVYIGYETPKDVVTPILYILRYIAREPGGRTVYCEMAYHDRSNQQWGTPVLMDIDYQDVMPQARYQSKPIGAVNVGDREDFSVFAVIIKHIYQGKPQTVTVFRHLLVFNKSNRTVMKVHLSTTSV